MRGRFVAQAPGRAWDTAQHWHAKTPREAKLIGFDFTKRVPNQFYLFQPVVTATPDGLTISDEITVDGPVVRCLIGGGVDGVSYILRCMVKDPSGELLEIEKRLRVAERAALI